jgi:RNA polymerase sigma factor (sigma-70 family)
MTEDGTVEIQRWLDRLRAGDPAARARLLDTAGDRLHRLARKMLRDYPRVRRWEGTGDVCQNATLRLWRALEDVRPATPRDFFRLAALQIRRELINLAEHYFGPHGGGANHASVAPAADPNNRSPQVLEPPDRSNDPGRLLFWAEFHRQVEALPEREREVFDLLWYQELTQAEARRLAGTPLPPREAARLVETLARAMNYAHSRGVVHRDLNPSNVLLTGDGTPKVTDFDLAKLIGGGANRTVSGMVLGTPSYMAPEQAAGKAGSISSATDVYALGAILYELLVGRAPFRSDSVLETLRQVLEEDPVPPRSLSPRPPRDLEVICLKCLYKEPRRRYASAEALAEDLRRWLAGEPVQARRAGPCERAGKWVRRQPALAALLVVTALGVIALMAGLLWHNDRLRAEAEKTARERDAARKAQRSARRAVNDMYTGVAEQWLADTPHMTDVQQEFLTKALEFYDEVVRDPGAEPEDRLELGRALSRIPFLNSTLTEPQEEAIYRESVRVLEGLVAEYPLPEYRLELARGYNGLGRSLVKCDRLPEAKAVLAQAHAEAERLHQGDPEYPEYRLEMATAQVHLAEFFRRNGQLAEARNALVKSRDQARWLVDHRPAVTRYHELLARTSGILGSLLFDLNSLGEAEACFLQARELLESLARESPGRPFARRGLAHTWEGLAGVLLAEGKVEEAEKAAGRGVDLRRELQDDFFRNTVLQWQALASARDLHAGILARLGRFGEAEAAFAVALPSLEKVAEVSRSRRRWEDLAVLEDGLAWLRLRRPAAESGLRELLPRLRRARTEAPAAERSRLALLGLAYYRLGDWEQALAVLRQLDAGPDPGGGPSRWTTDDHLLRRMGEHQEEVAAAVHAFCLAMTYHRLGRPVEVLDCYRLGLRLSEAQQTPPGFRSVDVETIRAEAADLLGLCEQPSAPREKR